MLGWQIALTCIIVVIVYICMGLFAFDLKTKKNYEVTLIDVLLLVLFGIIYFLYCVGIPTNDEEMEGIEVVEAKKSISKESIGDVDYSLLETFDDSIIYCKECGYPLEEEEMICSYCGYDNSDKRANSN